MATALLPAQLLARAADEYPAIVRPAAATPLHVPTPCAAWDLGALVRHLLYWAPFLAAAGRRVAPVPVAASEEDVDLTGWPDALDAARAEVVAAWSDPSAWEGTTSMGAPDPMPAEMIGGMVFGELVVHGWDLARSAGTHPEWPAEVLAAAHRAVADMAEQGRAMGGSDRRSRCPQRHLSWTGEPPLGWTLASETVGRPRDRCPSWPLRLLASRLCATPRRRGDHHARSSTRPAPSTRVAGLGTTRSPSSAARPRTSRR